MACLRNPRRVDERAEEACFSQMRTGHSPRHTAERATRTLEGLRADPSNVNTADDPFSPPPLGPDTVSIDVSLNVVRTPQPPSDPEMPS